MPSWKKVCPKSTDTKNTGHVFVIQSDMSFVIQGGCFIFLSAVKTDRTGLWLHLSRMEKLVPQTFPTNAAELRSKNTNPQQTML